MNIIKQIEDGNIEDVAMKLYKEGRYQFLTSAILDCLKAERILFERNKMNRL